jgi:hypothetical protein
MCRGWPLCRWVCTAGSAVQSSHCRWQGVVKLCYAITMVQCAVDLGQKGSNARTLFVAMSGSSTDWYTPVVLNSARPMLPRNLPPAAVDAAMGQHQREYSTLRRRAR